MVSDELVYYQPLFNERQQIRFLLVSSPSLQVREKKKEKKKRPFPNKQRCSRTDRQRDEGISSGVGRKPKKHKPQAYSGPSLIRSSRSKLCILADLIRTLKDGSGGLRGTGGLIRLFSSFESTVFGRHRKGQRKERRAAAARPPRKHVFQNCLFSSFQT